MSNYLNYDEALSLNRKSIDQFFCSISGKKLVKIPNTGIVLAKQRDEFLEVNVSEIAFFNDFDLKFYYFTKDFESILKASKIEDEKNAIELEELKNRPSIIHVEAIVDIEDKAKEDCLELLETLKPSIWSQFCSKRLVDTDSNGYSHKVSKTNIFKKFQNNYVELLQLIKNA